MKGLLIEYNGGYIHEGENKVDKHTAFISVSDFDKYIEND